MTRPHHGAAFTLMEVLISIMIFMVVSLTLVMVLSMAGTLFRDGSYSRAANDEAVAVLSLLADDLKRIIPASEGGWCFSSVDGDDGNCLLAFVIANPERAQITAEGGGARLLVAWGVDGTDLRRRTWPYDPGTETQQRDELLAKGAAQGTIVSRGCLHFGTWIALSDGSQASVPAGGIDQPLRWEEPDPARGSRLLPFIAEEYDAHLRPYPEALRVSVILTGGSTYAPRGRVVSDDGTTLRLSGIDAIPVMAGSLVRVGDEWIRVAGFAGNTLAVASDGRGALRSSPPPQGRHGRNAEVRLGRAYSLVRTFP